MIRPQFSLRALLIVVAILAVPCGYVGWQAKIVRDRNNAIREYRDAFMFGQIFPVADRKVTIPWIRRMLGDEVHPAIRMLPETSETEISRVALLFPEAEIFRAKIESDTVFQWEKFQQ